MVGLYLVVRSLEFGLAPDGIKRVDEQVVGSVRGVDGKGNTQSAISEALELTVSLRGHQYEFGRSAGLKLPLDDRPLHDRTGWLLQTLTWRVIPGSIAIDFLNNTLIRSSTILLITTGEQPFSQLDILHKIVIKFAVAFYIYTGMSLSYDTSSFLSVAVLGMAPSSWPPLFGRPWDAGSLHGFWARDWHQVSPELLGACMGLDAGVFS